MNGVYRSDRENMPISTGIDLKIMDSS